MTCEQKPGGARGSHRHRRGEGALGRGHSQSYGCRVEPSLGCWKEQRELMAWSSVSEGDDGRC